MESCERATSDFFSAMSSPKGYWYSLFDLDDTSFSLSQIFGVSIEELFDVFQTIGFRKKVGEKGLQFMQFNLQFGWRDATSALGNTYIDTRDTEGARVAVCPIEFKTFPRARNLWDTS